MPTPSRFDQAVLEFQDSEVARIECTGADLVLTFSAACVRLAAGSPHGTATLGYLAGLRMAFQAAACAGDLAPCQGRLLGGTVLIGGERLSSLRLPCVAPGGVSLHLQFANGATLAIDAAAMDCRPTGEEGFVESYAC